MASETPVNGKIEDPYLIVINIPAYRDPNGVFWSDPLWIKDLALHLEGIADLRLLCPLALECEPGWLPCAIGISIVSVPPQGRDWLLRAPAIWRSIDRNVSKAKIVHTGVAGWPYPLGWMAAASARLRTGKFLLIVVESSFWRIAAGTRASIGKRIKAVVWEIISRACCRAANLLVVTHPDYVALGADGRGRTFLNPASWVDDQFILDRDEARSVWSQKDVRFLYVGRLTADKGVTMLLDAIAGLGEDVPAIDIMGEGDLLDECRQAARAAPPGRIHVLAPVSYGQLFYDVLDRYQAILVPLRSDEQPRVVFDAFARAIPVLGTQSMGLSSVVDHGRTGLLTPVNDVDEFGRMLCTASKDSGGLQQLGMSGLTHVQGRTHRAMHAARVLEIKEALQEWAASQR